MNLHFLKNYDEDIKKNYFNLILILTSSLGFFLRLIFIISKPFWLDEVISFTISNLEIKDLLFQSNGYWDFSHSSLFYIFVKDWKLFGFSELWLRIPSLIFYLLSIQFLNKIFVFFKSSLISLFLVAYLSFHPLIILLNSELRMYSLNDFFIFLGYLLHF